MKRSSQVRLSAAVRRSSQCLVVLSLTLLLLGSPALAATPSYPSPPVVVNSVTQANCRKAKAFAVFSNDGDYDVFAITANGPTLYRQSQNWQQYVICSLPSGTTAPQYEQAQVVDINGDGWPDIVAGGWGEVLFWAENPMGTGHDPYTTPWTVHIIESGTFCHNVYFADMNKDGKMDVVTNEGIYIQGANNNWTPITGGRNSTGLPGFHGNGNVACCQGTATANMLNNGDGWNDLICTTYAGNNGNGLPIYHISWFENPGHTGGNSINDPWTEHIIDALYGGSANNPYCNSVTVVVGDLNNDGHLDVVAADQDGDQLGTHYHGSANR